MRIYTKRRSAQFLADHQLETGPVLVDRALLGVHQSQRERNLANQLLGKGEGRPVRPRRVRRTEPAPDTTAESGSASGFAAYAQDVGAADLPELLEAAAAYMSYVEGRDQFSRPQLMTTLRQAEVTDSSREDRLRSFGQLLREGKIRKTSGGRFTAAETISYKPAANG